ncbi:MULTISPECIES: hypothetical protein [Neobacillus]|jgi:hypothetical protein|uniref:Preprotein translocase subunit SecA n=1 Tax=Neobacillus sedimentimangrovi TaxID=2699460 RepID=A0ABS8QER0_9BACI|nr:hypothetical protein [Neobacillus sedimentimangrovi]AIM15096.1 preprotein translocase subunit SecA [Bacillus sp. X1(2014)]MCD4837703.1 hypothetical protein [Neobacillus sedimentimangrovi]
MFAVHFLENKNVLLCQLLRQVPKEGEELKIKGRKAKVTSLEPIDEKTFHVQVTLEPVKKTKTVVADTSKKKKK